MNRPSTRWLALGAVMLAAAAPVACGSRASRRATGTGGDSGSAGSSSGMPPGAAGTGGDSGSAGGGNSGGPTDAAAGGDSGSVGGGSSGMPNNSGSLFCPDGVPPYRGVRYEPDRDCLDTMQVEELGCRGQALGGGYSCVRRRADHAEFWATTVDELTVDPMTWERCPTAIVPPPPCFAAPCERAPRSLCSLQDTQREFACGSTSSEWDEQCCGRRECTDQSGCAGDEDCVSVPTRASWDCWPTAGMVACDCGGTPGGPEKMVCVPR